MQNRIGSRKHAFGLHQASSRMKEGEQFGGPAAHIFVGLHGGLSCWVPVFSWLWNSLIGTSFILAPQWQACGLSQFVGLLNQGFFSSALGSSTFTLPALRLRMAVPVGHQVRVLPNWYPASCNTTRMVSFAICGNSVFRRACRRSISDQVAI